MWLAHFCTKKKKKSRRRRRKKETEKRKALITKRTYHRVSFKQTSPVKCQVRHACLGQKIHFKFNASWEPIWESSSCSLTTGRTDTMAVVKAPPVQLFQFNSKSFHLFLMDYFFYIPLQCWLVFTADPRINVRLAANDHYLFDLVFKCLCVVDKILKSCN